MVPPVLCVVVSVLGNVTLDATVKGQVIHTDCHHRDRTRAAGEQHCVRAGGGVMARKGVKFDRLLIPNLKYFDQFFNDPKPKVF